MEEQPRDTPEDYLREALLRCVRHAREARPTIGPLAGWEWLHLPDLPGARALREAGFGQGDLGILGE